MFTLKEFKKVILFVFIVNVLIFTLSAQTKMRFNKGDSLETLRKKIKNNKYSFKVSDNWVYKLSKEDKAKMFSRHPSKRKSKAIIPDSGPLMKSVGRLLALKFDWRDIDGKSYIGAIRNQGSAGTCYAFGACAAAEGNYNFANGKYDENCVDFSESYIAWCLGSLANYKSHFFGGDGADYDYYEVRALTSSAGLYPAYDGICSESECPYSETELDPTLYLGKVTTIKFDSWNRVYPADYNDTTEYIKTAISTYGVLDAAVNASDAFTAYSSGVYEDLNTAATASPYYDTSTNHAIALVGWDDNPPEGGGGCWILRNSWGDSWGESGYMRIRYKSARVNCAAVYLIYATIPATVTLTMSSAPADGGSTTPVAGESTVDTGVAHAITATPAGTYTFSHWSYSGTVVIDNTSSASTTATLSSDATITANFNGGGGTTTILTMAVSPDSSGTTTPVAGSSIVTVGAAQSISATATDGYEFSGWSISGSGLIADSTSSSTTTTLDGNSTVTAIFTALADMSLKRLTISLDNTKDNRDRIIISNAQYPDDATTTPTSAEVIVDGISYKCSSLTANWTGNRYIYKSTTKEPSVRLIINVKTKRWDFRVIRTDIHDTLDALDGVPIILKINDVIVGMKDYTYSKLKVKTKIYNVKE